MLGDSHNEDGAADVANDYDNTVVAVDNHDDE